MTREEWQMQMLILTHEESDAEHYNAALHTLEAWDIAQRMKIEQQDKDLTELREWKAIILGTGTDQEAVIRMAATEYTKVAIQSWKEANDKQAKEIARLRDKLERISRHVPIMGSTGAYRQGQLDVLESVKRIAEEHP